MAAHRSPGDETKDKVPFFVDRCAIDVETFHPDVNGSDHGSFVFGDGIRFSCRRRERRRITVQAILDAHTKTRLHVAFSTAAHGRRTMNSGGRVPGECGLRLHRRIAQGRARGPAGHHRLRTKAQRTRGFGQSLIFDLEAGQKKPPVAPAAPPHAAEGRRPELLGLEEEAFGVFLLPSPGRGEGCAPRSCSCSLCTSAAARCTRSALAGSSPVEQHQWNGS